MSAHASRAFAPKKLPSLSFFAAAALHPYPKEAGAAATRADVEMFFVKSRHADEGIAARSQPAPPFSLALALHLHPKEAARASTRADGEKFFARTRRASESIAALCRVSGTKSRRKITAGCRRRMHAPFPSLPSRDNELGHAHDRRRQRIRHLRRKHVAKRAHVFDELFVDVVLFVVEPVRGDRLVAPRDGGRRR